MRVQIRNVSELNKNLSLSYFERIWIIFNKFFDCYDSAVFAIARPMNCPITAFLGFFESKTEYKKFNFELILEMNPTFAHDPHHLILVQNSRSIRLSRHLGSVSRKKYFLIFNLFSNKKRLFTTPDLSNKTFSFSKKLISSIKEFSAE